LTHWVDQERQRISAPSHLLDPAHRHTLDTVLGELYRHGAERIIRMGADRHRADEVIQIAADKLYNYILKADRLGRVDPIDNPAAYVQTTIINSYLTLRGGERRTVLYPVEELEEILVGSPDDDLDEAVWAMDRHALGERAQRQSWSGANTLGRVYEEQWNRRRTGGLVKTAVASRIEVACRLVADQRRRPDLVIPALPEGLALPLAEDRGRWLRRPVNQVLCDLNPEWGSVFSDRLPKAVKTEGANGRSEESNLSFLDDLCGGRPDDPRYPPDPFAERSTRRHGICGLLRLIYDFDSDAAGARK
jgi:DNA-directed RNA polymerase specialized sigma24 family protein